MEVKKKKLKLFDSVLMSVVVILVVEAAAPAAAIGNSQIFWWLFLFLFFFIPYGLISAELGTTYEDTGGIYDWVKRAFGHKMGTRVAWYYWINFPLWMASLAILCSSTITEITGVKISVMASLLIEIGFLLIVNIIGSLQVSQSKLLINIAAFLKAFIMLSLGAIAIYVAITKGVANDYNLNSMLPNVDIDSISFISVIIFNFLGFEVVTTLASDMENPKKEIPKAIILGGILIMIFYMISAFGIGVAIPADELILSSGLLDSFKLLLGTSGGIFITVIGIMFILTLFANLISWSLGINYVACHAAKNNNLPQFFALESKVSKAPIGAAIANFLVASALVVASHLISNNEMFWNFFALNLITLLLSYVFIFPAFNKLRRTDKDRERPFKVLGNKIIIVLMSYIPSIILIVSIILSAVPLNTSVEELSYKMPILIGTLVALIIGELLAFVLYKKEKNKVKESKEFSRR